MYCLIGRKRGEIQGAVERRLAASRGLARRQRRGHGNAAAVAAPRWRNRWVCVSSPVALLPPCGELPRPSFPHAPLLRNPLIRNQAFLGCVVHRHDS